ncbi:hypothetical protein [Microbacterium sp.]
MRSGRQEDAPGIDARTDDLIAAWTQEHGRRDWARREHRIGG